MPSGAILSPQINDPAISAMAVEEQLLRLIESPLFSHSRRYPGFLRYVVGATLKGQQDQLKERSIGIEVFHRSPDYDLNMDPVVRVTAGEVRKRLAQYYYEPEHKDELRIELHPGSYIPEFKLVHPQAGLIHAAPARAAAQDNVHNRLLKDEHSHSTVGENRPPPVTHNAGAVSTSAQQIHSAATISGPMESLDSTATLADAARSPLRHWRWVLAISIAVLILIGLKIASPLLDRHSALDQFWRPALQSTGPVLVSVGSWGTMSPNSGSLSIGTHAESVSPVALADTITIGSLQQFLSERSHAVQIQVSNQTSFSDLQRGTTILVSGFDNPWTMRLIGPLRFHFVTHDGNVLAIEDRNNPDRTVWQIDQNVPYASLTHDYAIIARFHDPTTEQMIVVAAGIGENGTIAAGQMLTNPQFFPSTKEGGWDFKARNIEAVIQTQVIDGRSGPPRVVAVTTW